MVFCAPRIPAELARQIVALDDGTRSVAEICRLSARISARFGRPQPSYERVRVLVNQARGNRVRTTAQSVRRWLDIGLRLRLRIASLLSFEIGISLAFGQPRDTVLQAARRRE